MSREFPQFGIFEDIEEIIRDCFRGNSRAVLFLLVGECDMIILVYFAGWMRGARCFSGILHGKNRSVESGG